MPELPLSDPVRLLSFDDNPLTSILDDSYLPRRCIPAGLELVSVAEGAAQIGIDVASPVVDVADLLS